MTVLARTPADVLRCAAQAFRTGEITWGRDYYIDTDGCRCTLGALAYAVDPDDVDGDPSYSGPVAHAAMGQLADYLTSELGAPWCHAGAFRSDLAETVAGWNDEPGRTVQDVIDALDAAAAHPGTQVAA